MVVATHSELLVNALRRRVIGIDGGQVVRDQARASYRDEEDERAAEIERRLAVAAVGAGPAVWPGRGARRG